MMLSVQKFVPKTIGPRTITLETKRYNFLIRSTRTGSGSNPNPITLPKKILLDEEFAEAVGMYIGDGTTNSKDMRHTSFTNKDVDIAKFMLDFFTNRFGIDKSRITLTIRYSFGLPSNLVKRWAKILNVPYEHFTFTKSSNHRYDALKIQVNSMLFTAVFLKLIYDILPLIKANKKLRRGFLRGYFAAEGNIGFKRKDNYIEYIGFWYNAFKESSIRNFCFACLKADDIKARYKERGSEGFIIINGWENYCRLWSIRIFDRCQRKRDMFWAILKTRKIYCELEDEFRQEFFSTLGIFQKKVAKVIGSWQSNVSRTIRGTHLLTIEQLKILLHYSAFTESTLLNNIEGFRIGNMKGIIKDKNFLKYLFSIRSV